MTHPRLPQYQVIGPDGPVGLPDTAYRCYLLARDLIDADNADAPEGAPRVVKYKVERVLCQTP